GAFHHRRCAGEAFRHARNLTQRIPESGGIGIGEQIGVTHHHIAHPHAVTQAAGGAGGDDDRGAYRVQREGGRGDRVDGAYPGAHQQELAVFDGGQHRTSPSGGGGLAEPVGALLVGDDFFFHRGHHNGVHRAGGGGKGGT